MYRPCCWYIFRVAAEIFGFLLAILPFAILAFRAIENDPLSRLPTLTARVFRDAAPGLEAHRPACSARWVSVEA